jgi:adenylate cyclase
VSVPKPDRAGVPAGADLEPTSVPERLANLIESNPAVCDVAVDLGIVDRHWLEQPKSRKPTLAPPVEVARRFFERTVERHPNVLASVGLNALQVLAWDLFWDRGLGRGKDTVSTAAVVFTDLEGFTTFTARNGDVAARTLLVEHHRIAAPIVRQWGGRIVKHLGDGLMLVFPDVPSAIHAALNLVPTAPKPLRLRAGVHAGDVFVTADDLIGHVVNVAARVTDQAGGGQVLVTADALAVAGPMPGVRVLRGRRRALKGIDQKMLISRVEAVPATSDRVRPAALTHKQADRQL